MKETINQRTGSGRAPSWNRLFPILSRMLVWSILFGFIYLLRSFFLLMFLTFVFAFIQLSISYFLKRFITARTPRVIIVAVLFLAFLSANVVFLVPEVISQARIFTSRSASYIQRVDHELLALGVEYPILDEVIPDLKRLRKSVAPGKDPSAGKPVISPVTTLLRQLFVINGEEKEDDDTLLSLERLRSVSTRIAGVVSSFMLAMLFSFLIILDLPNLTRMIRKLEHTRLGFIYVEVADTIRDFSIILGRALEAQFFIAIVNSVLTAIGIYFLGLGESLAFLSVIVFFCSFVPVLGVFISSVPISLLALQDSGLQGVLLVVVLITVIHLIEAYILNPNIYGTHLRINPVLVLIILTISGKLFHIWGLVLGVPVCTYLFGYAIQFPKGKTARKPQQDPPEPET